MRWSQTLIPTTKDAPAGKDVTAAHLPLLARAGYVRQSSSGTYDLLPLALRTLGKLQAVARRHLTEIGAVEVHSPDLPALAQAHPNVTLFSLSEQTATTRPRNGLLSPRHYHALHIHSPTPDAVPLTPVFELLNLHAAITTPTATLLPSPHGDTTLVTTSDGSYTAPIDDAQTAPRPWTFGGDPAGDLTKLHTPDTKSVPDLAAFLDIEPRDILKTIIFRATPSTEWTAYAAVENLTAPQWVLAVVRGDHDVNPAKLAAVVRETFHISSIELADAATTANEFPFGYVGPHAAISKLTAVLVVDYDAAQPRPWTAGANEPEHHVARFNWFRECGQPLADPRKVATADIRYAIEGDPSPNGGTLHLTPALQLSSTTLDPTPGGAESSSTTINLTRLLAAIVEANHAQSSVLWPPAISPYAVSLTPINYYTPAVKEATDRLYAELTAAGLEVLLDDRDLPPARKSADATLLGFPTQITLGPRTLAQNAAEIRRHSSPQPAVVQLDLVVPTLTTKDPR